MNAQTLTKYLVCYHTPDGEIQEVFASLDDAIEQSKSRNLPPQRETIVERRWCVK